MGSAAGGNGGAGTGAGGSRLDAAPDLPADGPSVTPDAAPDAPAADLPRVDASPDTGTSLLANGATCQDGTTQCQSGKCVDGVCCESSCAGQCQSCAEATLLGKCVTISGGARGTVRTPCPGTGTCASSCNGSDPAVCHYPGTEKLCVQASCTAGVAKVASTCNGTGACTTVTGVPCTSNQCADNTTCSGGCSAAQPCGATQYCEPTQRVCLPLKANGDACVQGLECTSQACVDSVCCESACAGQCEACAEAVKGKCVAVMGAPRGTKRPACLGTRDACRGMCDGISRTQCSYPGAEKQCVPAICAGGGLTSPSVCNMLGDCTMPTLSSCHSTQCSSTTQCLTCAVGLACAGGLTCDGVNGVCVAPASLSVSPASPFAFTSTLVNGTTSQTFVVTNNGGVPAGSTTGLVATLVGGDTSQFALAAAQTTCTGALAPTGRCNVVIQFKPTSPVAKTTTLTVTATPGGPVSVTLTGTGLRNLGDACSVGTDCPNGLCTDAHCCTQASCGTCMACTGAGGTCASVPLNSTACAVVGPPHCVESLTGTTLQTCSMANACTTALTTSSCASGTICERNPTAACLNPSWAEWPMPNGPTDVLAGAPNVENYTDNHDGTVTDNVTNLMWQQTPTGTFSRTAALAYCPTLTLSGHNDWRLPSLVELISIVDYGQNNPARNTSYFPILTSLDFFWSSEAPAGWQVYFDGESFPASASDPGFARCVR